MSPFAARAERNLLLQVGRVPPFRRPHRLSFYGSYRPRLGYLWPSQEEPSTPGADELRGADVEGQSRSGGLVWQHRRCGELVLVSRNARPSLLRWSRLLAKVKYVLEGVSS